MDTSEYVKTIEKVFRFDVNSESADIFPRMLCKLCHMKLYRLKSKVDAGGDCELTHPDTFYHFVPHSETCHVCDLSSKRRGRPAKQNIEHFDIVEEVKKTETWT